MGWEYRVFYLLEDGPEEEQKFDFDLTQPGVMKLYTKKVVRFATEQMRSDCYILVQDSFGLKLRNLSKSGVRSNFLLELKVLLEQHPRGAQRWAKVVQTGLARDALHLPGLQTLLQVVTKSRRWVALSHKVLLEQTDFTLSIPNDVSAPHLSGGPNDPFYRLRFRSFAFEGREVCKKGERLLQQLRARKANRHKDVEAPSAMQRLQRLVVCGGYPEFLAQVCSIIDVARTQRTSLAVSPSTLSATTTTTTTTAAAAAATTTIFSSSSSSSSSVPSSSEQDKHAFCDPSSLSNSSVPVSGQLAPPGHCSTL
eukprot:g75147.t1